MSLFSAFSTRFLAVALLIFYLAPEAYGGIKDQIKTLRVCLNSISYLTHSSDSGSNNWTYYIRRDDCVTRSQGAVGSCASVGLSLFSELLFYGDRAAISASEKINEDFLFYHAIRKSFDIALKEHLEDGFAKVDEFSKDVSLNVDVDLEFIMQNHGVQFMDPSLKPYRLPKQMKKEGLEDFYGDLNDLYKKVAKQKKKGSLSKKQLKRVKSKFDDIFVRHFGKTPSGHARVEPDFANRITMHAIRELDSSGRLKKVSDVVKRSLAQGRPVEIWIDGPDAELEVAMFDWAASGVAPKVSLIEDGNVSWNQNHAGVILAAKFDQAGMLTEVLVENSWGEALPRYRLDANFVIRRTVSIREYR